MANAVATIQALDAGIFHLINRTLENPLFDLLMPALSTKQYLILPVLVAMCFLALRGGRREWLLLLVGVAAVTVGDQGSNLLKALFHRTRPCHTLPDVHLLAGCTRSFSLPSNHATNMFAIAAVGWLMLRRWRWALPVLAAGVAYSRIYLGVHYPSDVILGAIWGVIAGWGCTRMAAHALPGWTEARPKPAPPSSA
jgi:undecaprenyl-diphosphatase